jgi:hypothetical protein
MHQEAGHPHFRALNSQRSARKYRKSAIVYCEFLTIIDGTMTLALSDDEKLALAALLTRTIEDDPYPLSPRVLTLKSILAKLRPEPTREPRTGTRHRRKPCCAPVSPRRPPELPGSSDRVLTYSIETQINPTAARVRPGRHHQPLG